MPDRHLLPDYPDLRPALPATLAALDVLLEQPSEFRQYCEHLRDDPQRPGLYDTSTTAFRYWYPIPTEIAHTENGTANEPVSDAELATWQWIDPFGDGAYHIDHGIEIMAADARDLWIINLSAPSMRTPVEGDFVLQAICAPSTRRSTTMGGLLLWHSPQDFVRLDWGGLGPGEISCLGCHNGHETFWGRGRTQCQQPFLRIERSGSRVRAHFSEDAINWLLVGNFVFHLDDDSAQHGNHQGSSQHTNTGWEAGFFALGAVDRTLFPQSSPGGAAVRVREIKLISAESRAV